MPGDRRRIKGPQESQVPLLYAPPEQVLEIEVQDYIPNRDPLHQRPVFVKAGNSSQAAGSAYLETGYTKIVVSVFGPRQVEGFQPSVVHQGRLVCNFHHAPFSRAGLLCPANRRKEKELSQALYEALLPAVQMQLYPRTQIEVYVLVLEDGGSALASGITASSLALADAGIKMYDVVVACGLILTQGDDPAWLLDPVYYEEKIGAISLTMAVMPNRHEVSAILGSGKGIPCELWKQGLQMGMKGCQRLYPMLRACLVRATRRKRTETRIQTHLQRVAEREQHVSERQLTILLRKIQGFPAEPAEPSINDLFMKPAAELFAASIPSQFFTKPAAELATPSAELLPELPAKLFTKYPAELYKPAKPSAKPVTQLLTKVFTKSPAKQLTEHYAEITPKSAETATKLFAESSKPSAELFAEPPTKPATELFAEVAETLAKLSIRSLAEIFAEPPAEPATELFAKPPVQFVTQLFAKPPKEPATKLYAKRVEPPAEPTK
ncbi:exosome complex component MTR3-like [Macrotis lagotis]|uniref:exosome complex component MTR3-like n=1 Tax=Macrotis lagotis TaxID=92651 RepID=UPI003D687647